MKIVLLRHGKVNYPPISILSSAKFAEWIDSYNTNELDRSLKPSEETMRMAITANAAVCSEMPRSLESAKVLGIKEVTLCHALFNEAGLPIAEWNFPRLSVRIWVIVFRLSWFFGYARNSESLSEAKARSSKAADRLIEIAEEYQSVVFVGHGIINHFIANELRNRGWIGPKSPSRRNWEYGVYKCKR
jgi:broad specificity phosphatase PhoE